MHWLANAFILGCSLFAQATVLASSPPPDTPPRRITLLGTLADWSYPGSKMRDGASMSDGGNPLLQSVKCQAVLTTPDSFEKVVEYYANKLETRPASQTRESTGDLKLAEGKSVSSQNDTRDHRVKLRILVVHKAHTSTTLVISRSEGESETHIAWSHYIRLEGGAEGEVHGSR
jgi:hypothetical protein